jgi:PEP-CTERM motif
MKHPQLLSLCLASAALTAGLLPSTAQAALPYGELSFVAPTGTVANNVPIDVLMRLTLDPASPALAFSSNPLTGFAPGDLPTQGYYTPPSGPRELRNFDSFDGAFLNVGAGCSGTFIGNCVAGVVPYTFTFYFGAGSLVGMNNFNLAAGGTHDFQLGTFTPLPGPAPVGTYTFDFALLSLAFYGQDALGNYLVTDGTTLAQTCPGCTFSRDVIAAAVPEPGTYAMLLTGLLGMTWMRRRDTLRKA